MLLYIQFAFAHTDDLIYYIFHKFILVLCIIQRPCWTLTPEEKRKVRAQRFAAAKEAQAKKKRSLTAVEESTEEEAPGESPALKTSKVDPTTATATTTTNPGEEASNDDNEESI